MQIIRFERVVQKLLEFYADGAKTEDWTSLMVMITRRDCLIVDPAREPFYGITQRRDRVARYFPILSVGATPSMILNSPAEQNLSDSILSDFAFLNPRKEVCDENDL